MWGDRHFMAQLHVSLVNLQGGLRCAPLIAQDDPVRRTCGLRAADVGPGAEDEDGEGVS